MKLSCTQKVLILREPGMRYFPDSREGEAFITRCAGFYPIEAEITNHSPETVALKIMLLNPNSGYMEPTHHRVWRWALTAHHVDVFDPITL